MYEMKHRLLFEPIRLAGQTFRNRIFASPQDHPYLTSENFLTPEAIAFYESKAIGGFGSVCVGDFMVDSFCGHSHPFQLRGDDKRGKAMLVDTALAITRHGAVGSVELNHAGENAFVMAEREGYMYGLVEGEHNGVPVRAMDDEYLERAILKFAQAADYARQSGFGMVTLHGGHGWMLAQFMSPRTNRRTDKWGGSLENRMRFPLAVIDAVRKVVGPAFPIEIRISGAEIVEGGYDIDEGVRIAEMLDGKVDLIHVSAGHHEDDAASMVTHPTMFLPDGVNVKYAAEIKKHVKTPVATVGALTDPAFMEELIASGKTDIVELGRQSLADPDLPIKARMGRDEDVNQCMRCFTCFSCSTVNGIFYCAINPRVGHELENKYAVPPRKRKKVLVAGGGIGGMQAALTCAEQGHEVILCEKSDKLGGALLCEHNVPFKQKLRIYLKNQARRVLEADIDLRLNTPVTPELARALEPDVIIAAMGARPVVPTFIRGWDRENVVGAEQVYYDPEMTGKNVVILGGGLVGLELGLWLAQLGRQVTVVEMAPSTLATQADAGTSERMFGSSGIRHGDPIVHGIAIAQELKKLPNMTVKTSTKALEIGEDGVRVEGKDGEYVIPADTVIYAVGQKPLSTEANLLYDCAPEFYQIGDCVAPRNIMNATSAAYQIARDIGRY